MRLTALLSALVLVCAPVEVSAEVVGVALDAKVKLVDGTAVVVDRAQDDGAAFFRLDDAGLTPLGQVALPTSYLGVPASVAVSPDERLALVSASVRLSSTHPKRYIEDDTLSVVDLAAKVPKLVQTLHLGISPSSVTFHPDGSWALITSNPGNALSILRRRGQRIELGPTLTMPDGAGPLSASFSPNGQWLLLVPTDVLAFDQLSISRLHHTMQNTVVRDVRSARLKGAKHLDNAGAFFLELPSDPLSDIYWKFAHLRSSQGIRCPLWVESGHCHSARLYPEGIRDSSRVGHSTA